MSVEAIAWAFKQNITPPARKLVLIALADNADTYGICFPSYRHLKEKTCLSRASVIRHVRGLVDSGIIEKVERDRANGSQTSNAYRLPIIKGEISDHPLSPLFKSGGVSELDRGVSELDQQGLEMRPLEPSLNHHLNQKEKKALTRAEFMGAIKRGFKAGSFADWEYLTETDILNHATACFDRHEAKGEWPGGKPTAILRWWIGNGVKMGKIQKPKDRDNGLASGSKPLELEHPLQPWQERIRPKVGEAVFRSWLLKMRLEGNQLIAPTRFHASHVEQNYLTDITSILPDVKITYLPQKETVNA